MGGGRVLKYGCRRASWAEILSAGTILSILWTRSSVLLGSCFNLWTQRTSKGVSMATRRRRLAWLYDDVVSPTFSRPSSEASAPTPPTSLWQKEGGVSSALLRQQRPLLGQLKVKANRKDL